MKIRNGFVSNSSSSSFIIGISKINDIGKFRNYVQKNDINIDDFNFMIKSKIDIMNNKIWGVESKNNKLSVDSFIDSYVSIDSEQLDMLDTLFICKYTGHDDSDFWNEGYGEYEYDIDISFFDSHEQDVYKMFFDEESGLDVKTSDVEFGAGRNG